MAQQAVEHLPDHLLLTTLVTDPEEASQPLDHNQVSTGCAGNNPPDVTLPSTAEKHMSDVGEAHLALQTDWFV
jgi:hypothetical protein